jgi:alpha-glucosidase
MRQHFVTEPWWQRGVIYQIYPRSFGDSNGDGLGDLRGICSHLDYCQTLGVDALWLSPIFPSPMADFGYDVADYTGIDARFGTLADFDALLEAVKSRGMKLLLDFVPNHTSDRHPWFQAARRSRNAPRRDWYLWRDPAPGGGPPNNWLSHFGGSAWSWDEATGQYYYHSFLKEQPDLNWRNPAVVEAMHAVLRFWMRRGVDGFRIDVLWLLIKDDLWRDNPPNAAYRVGQPLFDSQIPLFTADRPELPAVIAGLREVADEFSALLIGEIYLPLERLMSYYGNGRLAGVQLPFNFQLLQASWSARDIGHLVDTYEAGLPPGAWPNWVLGNHDRPRIASRVGIDQANVAAMLLLTLRGTPTMYYGDEIGMQNVPIAPGRVQDPLELNVPGKGLGRDPCRTPMQWNAAHNAGFSTAEPWLPLAADFDRINVAVQSNDPRSRLTLYRALLALRRENHALSLGDYRTLACTDSFLAYLRSTPQQRLLIVLNFTALPVQWQLPEICRHAIVLLSSALDRGNERIRGNLELRAHEGLVLEIITLQAPTP